MTARRAALVAAATVTAGPVLGALLALHAWRHLHAIDHAQDGTED